MSYQETIRPPWWMYATVIGLSALLCFTFAAVVTVPPAVVLFVILAALGCWLVERRSMRISVRDDVLQVGSVALPRDQILSAQALDEHGLFEAAGPDADARAFMVLRDLSTATGVKVDLKEGSVPYWLVSSKNPADLAAALNA